MTLKFKLTSVFTLVVLLAAAGIGLGILKMGELKAEFDDVLERKVRGVALANEISAESVWIARSEKMLLLAPGKAEKYARAVEMDKRAANIDQLLAELRAVSEPSDQELLDAYEADWQKYLSVNREVREASGLQSILKGREILQNEGLKAYEAVAASMTALKQTLSNNNSAVAAFGGTASNIDSEVISDIEAAVLHVLVNIYSAMASSADPETLEAYAIRTEQRIAGLMDTVKVAENTLPEDYQAHLAEMLKAGAVWLPLVQSALEKARENGDYAALQISNGRSSTARRAADAQLTTLIERLKVRMDTAQTGVAETYALSTQIQIGSLVAMVLIAAVAAIMIVRGIYRQLGGEPAYAQDVLRQIADGDLSATIKTRSGDHDSLLAALANMTERLKSVVGDVSSAARNVASGSEQMAASSEQLSQGASEQAASSEETSASVEEMAATINQTAENTNRTETIALKAAQDAET
ncbi:HAMP domain-containing methyl-accepting chemotaxis protein, partial [Thalassovita gelatinovora]